MRGTKFCLVAFNSHQKMVTFLACFWYDQKNQKHIASSFILHDNKSKKLFVNLFGPRAYPLKTRRLKLDTLF